MAAFAVISAVPNEALELHLRAVYPDMSFTFADNAWLVADQLKTTQEVCTKLNIRTDGFANAIVVKIDGYFGFATPTIWEWLKVKGAAP